MGILRKQAQRLLAVPFVLDGIETLRDPVPRAKTLAPTLQRLHERYPWLPEDPLVLVRAQGAAATAGGALLLTGRFTRAASLLLAAQCVPTIAAKGQEARHTAEPAERQRRRGDLIKDLSLLGALVLSATEPRRRSARARRSHDGEGR